ncbi:MAG TPA: GtrA family protein [Clostridiaceae bacterium]|nr:GtrA family protein [Clostridiaceae bacterium]
MIRLLTFIKRLFKSLINNELMRYGIIGFLTTLINMVVYGLCTRLGLNYLIANTIAFIIAVLFAFVANDRIVFKVKRNDPASVFSRLIKFFAMRAGSYLVDMLLMFFLIDILKQNDIIGKALTNIVVIILNYIMSKYFIFRIE